MPVTVHRERWTSVPKAALVARLRDTLAWPEWSPMDVATIERAGPDGPSSPGEIRSFTSGRTTGREEVLPSEGDVVLRYRLLEGMPMDDYVGEVKIEERDGRRLVSWSSRFEPRIPLTGWLFRFGMGQFFDKLLDGLISGRK